MDRAHHNIPVLRPGYGQEELDAVKEVFQSGWLGPSPKTAEFEKAFGRFVGVPHSIAVSSGTVALHLTCRALGLGSGDEVLVPSLTFASTAHAPSYCGSTVVFVDSDEEICNLDPDDLRKKITNRSKAIIPVHYGGHPADLDEIWAIAEENGLWVIEDAAHACGAEYRGSRVSGLKGTHATCFSFNALKNLSTGDGGMVATPSASLAEKIRQLRWMGIDKSTFERSSGLRADSSSENRPVGYQWFYNLEHLGYRYSMNDISAAIGLVQLGKLEGMQAIRRRMARRYAEAFSDLEWLRIPVEKEDTRSGWHLYPVKTA